MRRKSLLEVGAVILIFLIVLVLGLALGWWAGHKMPLQGDEVSAKGTGDLIQGEAVARQIWGPVCGGENVDTTFAPLADGKAGLAQSLVTVQDRRFQCHVTINNSKAYKKITLCAIVVHEYGHLAGREHSDNPKSVMYPTITKKNIPRGCKA